MVLLSFRQGTVFGDQDTLSATQVIGDRPQFGGHCPCAVFDLGDHAACSPEGVAQFGLGDSGRGAVGGQLRTQAAPQGLHLDVTSCHVPRIDQHRLTLVGVTTRGDRFHNPRYRAPTVVTPTPAAIVLRCAPSAWASVITPQRDGGRRKQRPLAFLFHTRARHKGAST